MAAITVDAYRRPLIGAMDPLFKRCLIGSSVIGLVALIVMLVTPMRDTSLTSVDQLPQRLAKLIVEKPKPPAPAITKAATIDAPKAPDVVEAPPKAPEPIQQVQPRRRRVDATRTQDPSAGQAGREAARKAVSANLAQTTRALDKSLADLSSSLASTSDAPSRPARRSRRGVRSGRSSGDLASVNAGQASSGAGADLGGSAVSGAVVAVGTIEPSTASPSESGVAASGSAPGVHRTNASLLAVVQKYAAGIQYCYDNELKRNTALSGKLVVSITVAASGRVESAFVTSSTVGSPALAECALAQIRDWKFPVIAEGVTTFQAPFVFTPPR